MRTQAAIKAFSALAHEGRLAVFRLVASTGSTGIATGDIARTLDLGVSTVSMQLAELSNARLLRARREGRSMIYFVDLDAVRDLAAFLMEDCCGAARMAGRPDQPGGTSTAPTAAPKSRS